MKTIQKLTIAALISCSLFTSLFAADLTLPTGVIFRIRIMEEDVKDLPLMPLTSIKNGAEAGVWTDYSDAEKNKLVLIAQGYNNIEIVAYQDRKKIPLETARKISGQDKPEMISVEALDSLLNTASRNLYIAIPASSIEDVEILSKTRIRFSLEKSSAGVYEYRMGKFESLEDAETCLSLLNGMGIKSATLAYSL